MQSAFGEHNSLGLKRRSSSSQDFILANKRKCVTSTYYPPPSRSPNVTTITTSNGEKIELVDDVCDDRFLEQSSYSEDSLLLPCRVRRNYACKACNYATTNPRLFLYHQRDAHAQKGSIHECQHCMYASVHSHKLLRHISLVHRVAPDSSGEQANYLPPPSAPNAFPHLSADGMPLPPDLEVILVEDDPSPSTSVAGARKTVRPMLMEPSVVFLPLTPQQQGAQQAPPYLQPAPPPLHRRKIHPRHHIQHASLPPPPLLTSVRPPPPLFNSAQPQRKANALAKDKTPEEFSCSVCAFKSKSRVLVQRHEKVSHLKKKFFRCTKCNYVTSVRARYTKHVRYHDMPYIKCETCDFSTPYKWNLDRHRRNHLEEGDTLDGGAPAGLEVFRCYKCTFSTLSKQSLSVHLLNHHSEGGGYRRPRRMDEHATHSNPVTPPSPARSEHRQEPEHPAENEVKQNDPAEDGEDEAEEDEEEEEEEEEEEREEEEAEGGSVDVEELDENEDEVENDSSSKPYACVECRETFPSVSLLDRHAYEFHEIEHPRRPPERKRTMTKRPDGKPKVKCDLCPYEAKWISEVVRHRRVHIQDKPYACPHCEFRSRWKGDMTRHIMKYHGGEGESSSLESSAPGRAEAERAKNSEVNNLEQLLDQSMMVGGEEDLNIFNGRMANPPPPAATVPAQDLPLDLSRPIDELNMFSTNKARDSNTGLLPFLLRIPPRRIPQQEINMPINLSPSLQLIPTSKSASSLSSTAQKMMAPPGVRAQRTLTISPSIAVLPVPKMQVTTTMAPININVSSGPVSPEKSDKNVNAPIIRKTFQCPYCTYSTTTASRFHMHIVVHLNQKPYMCSECGYRSNWQWDITKHSKMKAPRDPRHASASVIVVNDSGNKNYEKYEKYAVYETLITKTKKKTSQVDTELAATPESSVGNSGGRTTLSLPTSPSIAVQLLPPRPANVRSRITKKITFKCKYCEFRHTIRRNIVRHMSVHSGNKPFWCGVCGQSSNCRNVILRHCHVRHGAPGPIMQRDEGKGGSKAMPYPPGVNGELGFEVEEEEVEELIKLPETPEQEHLDEPLPPPPPDPPSSPPGTKDSSARDESVLNLPKPTVEVKEDKSKRHKCSLCPYRCRKLFDLRIHSYMHKPHEGANFKCMFCPFYVSLKRSWLQHMKLHVDQPHEYIKHCQEGMPPPLPPPVEPKPVERVAPPQETPAKISAAPVATSTPKTNNPPKMKRYRCEQCPYRTDSHTTFLYHRQFHRPGRTGVFKCTYCSYAVSKSHLLMQHLRLHEAAAAAPAPTTSKAEVTPLATPSAPRDSSVCSPPGVLENPPTVTNVCRVWVQRDGVFKKMFKCPHCPHISMKRAVITDHEKMHYKRKSTLGKATFMCNLCNYTCKNSGALTSHQRMHREHENSLGYISEKDYASSHPVAKPKATKNSSPAKEESVVVTPVPITISKEERWTRISTGGKQFFTCGKCPAKFTKPQQMAFHRALHGAAFKWKCTLCDYAARHRPHLHKHAKVHTPEYQSDYKPDASNRDISSDMLPTKKAGADAVENSTPGSPVTNSLPAKKGACSPPKAKALDNGKAVIKKNYSCHLCPSIFFKYSTLVYHLHLHGSNAKFKCQHCTYAVANIGNLVRHAKVHVPAPKSSVVSASTSPSKNVSSMENSAAKCQLVCPKCPAVFEKKLRYDIHVGLHGSKQRFQCDRCDYAVQFAANMVRHRRMHADDEKKTMQLSMANGYLSPTRPSGTNSKISSAKAQGALSVTSGAPSTAPSSESKEVSDLLEETLKSIGESNITPVEKQHLLLQRLQSLQSRKTMTEVPKEEDPCATSAEPKKLFRCERCPYSSQRKDAVQSHMRRHVTLPAFESTCPHCDYGSSLTSFLKEHIKLHFKPFRFHQVDAFVEWEEFEIWAKFGNTKRLIYRHSVDGKEFTEEDVYEVSASSSPAPREEDEEELDRMEDDADCGSELDIEKASVDEVVVESVMNSLLDKVESVESESSGEVVPETSNGDMYEDISACDSSEETTQDKDYRDENGAEMQMDTSYGIMKTNDKAKNVEIVKGNDINGSADAMDKQLKDDECLLTTTLESKNDEKSKGGERETFTDKEFLAEMRDIVDNLSKDA